MTRESLTRLAEVLAAEGYCVVGPAVRDGAVVLAEWRPGDGLPTGWVDEQGGGTYRLSKSPDAAVFGYGLGPHSWKRWLYPPATQLWRAAREGNRLEPPPDREKASKLAFVGVRSCELHAMAIQDRVFLGGNYVDPLYRARRESAFIVAVNCGQAGGTCFCVSMNTGPRATFGFDLALTEVLEDGRHDFVVEVGTEAGARVLSQVPHQTAGDPDRQAADRVIGRTAGRMVRALDATNLKELLYRNYEHPRWEEVASRCLTCANCTLVCPTCFCHTVEDATDLKGRDAERCRQWDSCFTLSFSYIHGGSVRASAKARYRQWLTHKLATWLEQYGLSGCVGCGRCITWCPVGIDLTEEVRAIGQSDGAAQRKE